MKKAIKIILILIVLIWFFYHLFTDTEDLLSLIGWFLGLVFIFAIGYEYGKDKCYCSDIEDHKEKIRDAKTRKT